MIKKLLKRPYRTLLNTGKMARNFLGPTAMILLYHRVAQVASDPHRLCVGPENFRTQIQYLKKNFQVIPLGQLVNDLKNQQLKNKTLVITFDDGYADNLYQALPILEEFKVPATIFITTGQVDKPEPFYWEEKTGAVDRGRSLTSQELTRLAVSPMIEIGAHAVSHRQLTKLDPAEQAREITESKAALEATLNKKIYGFAYPFGDSNSFNNQTINLVKKAGYQYACATGHKRVMQKTNLFSLPRYIIRNWNLSEFKDQIKHFI